MRENVIAASEPQSLHNIPQTKSKSSHAALSHAMNTAVDLLYPPSIYCVACGNLIDDTRPYAICDRCRREIDWRLGALPSGHEFSAGYYCAAYTGWVKNMVRDMKYHDKPYIAESIAEIMSERAAGETGITDADIIVPTPMYLSKRRRRGYNQAELIAARLAKLLGIRYVPDILAKTQPTEALSTKNRDERALLLADAFTATTNISLGVPIESPRAIVDNEILSDTPAPRILLIDDVFTTGATADACTRALRKAGAGSVRSLRFRDRRHARIRTLRARRALPLRIQALLKSP